MFRGNYLRFVTFQRYSQIILKITYLMRMLSVNQKRRRKSTVSKSSGAETKKVSGRRRDRRHTSHAAQPHERLRGVPRGSTRCTYRACAMWPPAFLWGLRERQQQQTTTTTATTATSSRVEFRGTRISTRRIFLWVVTKFTGWFAVLY